MSEINWKPLVKQYKVMEYLMDNTTKEVLYGGSAGSGKSYLGCAWIIMNCVTKPGTRWLIGRSKLSQLKGTTMKSFVDVAKEWGLERDVHYFWPNNSNEVKFSNGSEVILKDLFLYPSDPDFDSLGSLEISGAFLDEASQIVAKARDVVASRIRYKLNEYNMIGKILMTCNPSKNFLYSDFYQPHKDNTLPNFRKFIPALPTDNPFLPTSYLETLSNLDNISKQRLLLGNWEYDDDPASLITYDNIIQSFNNQHIELIDPSNKLIATILSNGKESKGNYITVDVARLGSDSTVIIVWTGLKVIHIEKHDKITTNITVDKVKALQKEYNVPTSHIAIDVDGVGGGVADYFTGSYNFNNNGKPLNNENYNNIKSQCYFRLAKAINDGEIWIDVKDKTMKELIIEELEQIKRDDIDSDGKLKVISKQLVKYNIGRSPDFSDALMMRMVFLLKNTGTFTFKMIKI